MRVTGIRKWAAAGILAILAALVWNAPAAPGARAAGDSPDMIFIKIPNIGDSSIRQAQPAQNYGAGPLLVQGGQDNAAETLVLFDLSVLPANGTLVKATLRLYRSDQGDAGLADLGTVAKAWNEETVTWDSAPATQFPTPRVAAAVSGSYSEWDVTPIVNGWLDNTMPNHGFAVRNPNSDALIFASRESVYPPELQIQFEPSDDPDDQNDPNNPYFDLGDAPDSTNHHNKSNRAYAVPNTPGHFPTVRDGATGTPTGPRHRNETVEGYLGNVVTRETEGEADKGADADGVNNILDGGADVADQDRGDDGWLNRNVPLVNCQRATLKVRVHRGNSATLEKMYLNVWHDGNRDGDWEDTGACTFENGEQARSYEWIVQDWAIDMTQIPLGGSADIQVNTLLVHSTSPDRNHWMRFTLGEGQAPRNPQTGLGDGRGPLSSGNPADYKYGETEDYLQKPLPDGNVQPDDLVLTKTVTGTFPAASGDSVTYELTLENRGYGAVQAEIRDIVAYPQHVVVPESAKRVRILIYVEEMSLGASPLSAELDYAHSRDQIVRWRGTLGPGAKVRLLYDVHVHPLCPSGQSDKEIANTARAAVRTLDGTLIANPEKTASFRVLCPDASPEDIQLRQSLSGDWDGSTNGMDEGSVGKAAQIAVVTGISNQAGVPVRSGIFWLFDAQPAQSIQAAAGISQTTGCRIVTLEPGETISVTTPVDLAALLVDGTGVIPDDAEQGQDVLSTAILQLLPDDATTCVTEEFDPNLVRQHTLKIHVRPHDLGDAPDGTNHAAAAMTAYPAVPARFPTVFDAATDPGGPQGPVHVRPRPFHLGKGVEFEVDADLAPAPRNINPPANTPDRDDYDDGALPHMWTLKHCETTTVPVRVFISPQAAAWFAANNDGTGYLNIWIDGNRNGSWADGGPCEDAAGNEQVALEHIVIDHPVDVNALGPGLHTIPVTTGAVPWPAAQAQEHAWVRLTLSERKSNKTLTTAGVSHGDGRGYAVPFRTGETEDYLLRPPGSAGDGPQLEIAVTVRPSHRISSSVDVSGPVAAAPHAWYAKFDGVDGSVKASNSGTQRIENAKVTLYLPAEWPDDTLFRLVSWPDMGLQSGWTAFGGFRGGVTVAVGDLDPGEAGHILVLTRIGSSGQAGAGQAGATAGPVQFKVVGSGDNVPDVEAMATVEVEPPPPMILGIKSPNSQYLSQAGGMTCSDEVAVFGSGTPGETVIVYLVNELGIAAQEEVTVGDANGDDVVDAADYIIWRDAGFLAGDYNDDGVVNAADYDFWRANFGQTSALSEGRYKISACRADDAACKLATGAQTAMPDQGDERQVHTGIGELQELVVTKSSSMDLLSLVMARDRDGDWFIADSFSFGVERSSQAHLRPGATYDLSAALCSNEVLGGSFTYDAAGNRVVAPLTVEDGKLTGSFKAPDAAQAAMTGADKAILTVYASAGTDLHFETPLGALYQEGTVMDQDGKPLAGAEVTLLYGDFFGLDDLWTERMDLWQGSAYGQQNPQTTGADGKYAFRVPRGRYRLIVRKDGYQPYLSRPTDLKEPGWIGRDVALTAILPYLEQDNLLEIAITALGFDPPISSLKWSGCQTCTVTAGDVTGPLADHRDAPLFLNMRNVDSAEHAVRIRTQQTGVAELTEVDGGVLAPGDSYSVLLMVSPGNGIEFSDPTDPAIQGRVFLEEVDNSLFLPSMHR